MAKKEKAPIIEEAQKNMDKYAKAVESEKKGKKAVASILFSVLLIFIILFAIMIKSYMAENQKGKVIVFDSDAENPYKISAHTEDAENIEATNLADYLAEKASSALNDKNSKETTTVAETTTQK